jgi:hypothetical protein
MHVSSLLDCCLQMQDASAGRSQPREQSGIGTKVSTLRSAGSGLLIRYEPMLMSLFMHFVSHNMQDNGIDMGPLIHRTACSQHYRQAWGSKADNTVQASQQQHGSIISRTYTSLYHDSSNSLM